MFTFKKEILIKKFKHKLLILKFNINIYTFGCFIERLEKKYSFFT